MAKDKLTYKQKDIVKEALLYYRDAVAVQKEKRSINQAIEKIQRLL